MNEGWHTPTERPSRPAGSQHATIAISEAAFEETRLSGLPGWGEGPADALRHLIAAAELRRRFGPTFALAALVYNEGRGELRGYPIASGVMDMENNLLGIKLGAQARTFSDVVRLAQAAVHDAIVTGGTDRRGAVWREQAFWREESGAMPRQLDGWQPPGPQSTRYEFGAAAFRYLGDAPSPRQAEKELLERLADTPVADWSYEDVLGVIRSRPYSSSANASRPAWHARVREWFRLRESERDSANIAERVGPKADAAECGGTAQVRAHTRNTAHGPVQVAAHTRTVTCGR